MNDSLGKLGFDASFNVDPDPSIPPGCVVVRITQVQKDSYFVTDGNRDTYAEVTGRLMYGADSPLDLPVTGDFVLAQLVDESLAIIHSVLPRKSILKRKTPGKKTEFQPIASNIDTAMIVQALDDDFSPRRLERYLVMIREGGGILPIVLLSKCDLVTRPEIEAKMAAVSEIASVGVTVFSNETGEGLDAIDELIKPGNTHCLLGSSGVGKSTLLNRLAGAELMETQEIRHKDGKGRHTTTARQLLVLASGAMIIDTPGMRELGNIGAGDGFAETFEEIDSLLGTCRFGDCSHQHEKGCAILEAVENGKIAPGRFESYQKMLKEFAHNESNFLDKKKRAKSLGKIYRSVQKNNPKERGK